VSVEHSIKRGQGADLAMSMILPPGGIRVVLNWASHSRDLDSWTYFDTNFKKFVYYGRPRMVGPTSGVSVALDWDDVDGHGPETSTYLDLGKCTDSCLIKFHVDNYSYRDAHLGDSEGIVTVYEGNGVKAVYNIPSNIGDDRGWTVFTLDSSDIKIYEGDMIYAPFIKKANGMAASTNWAGSMDFEGWSKVPVGSVLYGMSAYAINRGLEKLGTAYYYIVQNKRSPKPTITQIDWTGTLADGGTAMCPEGSWVSALYRKGSNAVPPKGPHQIVKAECSSFEGVPDWGKCTGVDSFQDRGQDAARCPDIDGVATAMVGLHHKGLSGKNSKLKQLDTIKCCAFPKNLVTEPEAKLCIQTQTCTGLMGKQ